MSDKVVWIGIVVGLLALSVAAQGILIVVAITDPSFALEPDYERKAARWDDIRRQQARNLQLGWTVDLRATPAPRPGEVEVALSLFDRHGKPIPGATVEVVAFHNARASDSIRARLDPVDRERYSATLPIRRPGVWEFRIAIRHGEDRFTRTIRKSVAVAPRFGSARS